MNEMQRGASNASDSTIFDTLVAYFSSTHWRDYLGTLESGPHIRHAHAYYNSAFDPQSIAYLMHVYFQRYGRPLERKIKILPVTETFLNVYNIQPKGLCHWEFFMNYAPDILLLPHDGYGARGAHSTEFWDDAFMEQWYSRFSFKDIGSSERADADAYFRSPAFQNNLLINIDDFGGVIHSHALVESSLHPEQLLPIGAAHIERKGWEIIRAVSVVFNNFGLDIGKLTYLLKKPEIVIEVEWHYNPEVTIRAASIPHFRVATSHNLSRLLSMRPYVAFDRAMAAKVVDAVLGQAKP